MSLSRFVDSYVTFYILTESPERIFDLPYPDQPNSTRIPIPPQKEPPLMHYKMSDYKKLRITCVHHILSGKKIKLSFINNSVRDALTTVQFINIVIFI